MEEADGNLYDYKIHCFIGKPMYIHVIGDRDIINHTAYESFYDIRWILQSFTSNVYTQYCKTIERPKCLDQMLYIAEKLSKEFIYVRVDLYVLDNPNIKFGEMTFTPNSGLYSWKPYEAGIYLGKLIELPIN